MDETTYDSNKRVWIAPKGHNLFEKSTSIGCIALSMLRAQPSERICQISHTENTELSYGEASKRAVQVATFLKNKALNDEDVIGIVAQNTTYLMPVMLGCWLNCTPIHVVSTIYDEDTVRHVFSTTKPKLIFCDGLKYGFLKKALKDLPITYYTLCNHQEAVPQLQEIFETTKYTPLYTPVPLKHSNQTMAIYCTSGTTGAPKCVPYPNSRCLIDSTFINSSIIMYSTSGPAWGSGLLNMTYNMLYGSQRIITTHNPSTEQLIEVIKKYDVSYFAATPMEIALLTQSTSFNKSNLPSLQLVFMTGSACTTATLQRFRVCMPTAYLIQSYGCTEFGGIAYNFKRYEMGVLGTLTADIRLQIVDPATKKALDYNENGEICVWKPEKWSGYIGNAAATQEVLDDDGWLHTGDMGYMDAENILHFVDRYKDILKYNGYQYSPVEIEEVISELHFVEDVCVFGVFNEEFGDLAAAAVVMGKGANLSETAIVEHVAKRLVAKHKCLNYGVFFVAHILRNSNGKVLRNQMRDLCLGKLKE